MSFLAEGHWRAGQKEDGLRTLAEALAQVDKSENRSYEAELYRLKGTFTLHTGASEAQQLRSEAQGEAEAENYFHRAIEIAGRQGAKSLELRAGTSLARLWQQQDRIEEARAMLAEIYNWFTEGFDTADLKDARALLGQLSA